MFSRRQHRQQRHRKHQRTTRQRNQYFVSTLPNLPIAVVRLKQHSSYFQAKSFKLIFIHHSGSANLTTHASALRDRWPTFSAFPILIHRPIHFAQLLCLLLASKAHEIIQWRYSTWPLTTTRQPRARRPLTTHTAF